MNLQLHCLSQQIYVECMLWARPLCWMLGTGQNTADKPPALMELRFWRENSCNKINK